MKGQSETYQNLLYAAGEDRPDEFQARRAGATTLRVRGRDGPREVLAAEVPVDRAVDCESEGLPRPAARLEELWDRSQAPAPSPPTPKIAEGPFGLEPASATLERPLRRPARFQVASTPEASQSGGRRTWPDTADLEIVLTLPEAMAVDCLRLVTITKMVPFYGVGSKGYGQPHYEEEDFTFSLILSDDVRTVEAPRVAWEETPAIYVGHGTLSRLPTWRIAVGGKAKQVKLLPRATTKERAALHLTDIEVYAAERVPELSAQALAAHIDGDGSNELVVGASEKELAAFGADGELRWKKSCHPGDIHLIGAADLEEDGEAEVLAYLTSDELRRYNGDGTERARGDTNKAQLQYIDGRCGFGNVRTMVAWKPEGGREKEVAMWAEPMLRVFPDGTVKIESSNIPAHQGVSRLVGMVPGEPEVLATVSRYGVMLWSARRDAKGGYTRLGTKPSAGPDSGEGRGLGRIHPVDVPGFKGVLAAIEGGVSWLPIAAFVRRARRQAGSTQRVERPPSPRSPRTSTATGCPRCSSAARMGS